MKTILVDAVNTLIIPHQWIDNQLLSLLDSYQNPKIILTNANHEQMRAYGLDNMPYDVFSLHHNPDKINPTYYTTMLAFYNLAPDNVVYFEHNIDAVQSAIGVGINTFHYNTNTKDLHNLKHFLDTHI